MGMRRKIALFALALLTWTGAMAQRVDITINDGWEFKGVSAKWEKVRLPHSWNNNDSLEGTSGYYRGVGYYRKQLFAPEAWDGKCVVLKFEGVNQVTTVHVNGTEALTHKGGYTAFSVDISKLISYGKDNLLEVIVDNSHNENVPPLNADFTFYGGVYRDVHLIVADDVHFNMDNYSSDGVFVETVSVAAGGAVLSVRGSAVLKSKSSKYKVKVSVLDGNRECVAEKTAKIKSGEEFKIGNIAVKDVKLWSPEQPYLYTVHCALLDGKGKVCDEISIPYGIRTISFDGNGFYLNGKKYTLRGSCRHQDWEGLGNAIRGENHRMDFETMKSMGFNFVRLAHYPQAPEVYRLCDRLGLLVWSEIPVVNQVTDSEEFFTNACEMQREHIRQTFNHPSVIIYGYMNEVLIKMLSNRKITPEKRKKVEEVTIDLARKLETVTKEEAPDRYTAMAIHYHSGYNECGITDIPDIIGYNLYFGWYYGNLVDLKTFLDEEHAKYPDRPIIVSEYGAGSDISIHSEEPMPWDFSEEYSLLYHQSYLRQFASMPYLAGTSLWIFADFGSNSRGDTIPFVNQKGLVTFSRRDKSVAYLYRAMLGKEPVIHIAEDNNHKRVGYEGKSQIIRVISNCAAVELICNGESLGIEKVVDGIATFYVLPEKGMNHLVATSPDSKISDELDLDMEIVPDNLNEWDGNILAVNTGAPFSYRTRDGSRTFLPDRVYEEGSWGRIGGTVKVRKDRLPKIGISNNILLTNDDPIYQTFCEGLDGYYFNVPDGRYRVTLLFMEYSSAKPEKDLIYNLSDIKGKPHADESGVFNVMINGITVREGLNITKEFGTLTASEVASEVKVLSGEGLKIETIPVTGRTILSGIVLEKL